MAVGRVKTWISAETLTAADLNAEINNVLNNGEDLAYPASKAKDFNGQELILDADADTSITADTDDRIDFRASGADLFRMDGTATTPVNGISFVASATGVAVHAIALGSDTNIDIEIRSKGSGDVVLADDSGNEILVAADVASAVNEVTITNAATGNPPIIQSTGEANIGFQLQDSNSNEVLLGVSTASAVNEITATNAATGNAPSFAATGGDTNISLNLATKGTGVLQVNGTAIGVWELIGTATASASATVDFTWAGKTYRQVILTVSGAAPATDNAIPWIRTTTDASTFDAGASDYGYAFETLLFNTTPSPAQTGDNADAQIVVSGGVGNDTNENISGEFVIIGPSDAVYTTITWSTAHTTLAGTRSSEIGTGMRISAADVDGIRFLFSTGNIASGEFSCYGLT